MKKCQWVTELETFWSQNEVDAKMGNSNFKSYHSSLVNSRECLYNS